MFNNDHYSKCLLRPKCSFYFLFKIAKVPLNSFMCLSIMNILNVGVEKRNITWVANNSKSIKTLCIIKFLSVRQTKVMFI